MLTKIAKTLKEQKNVCIITHVNPDGDALGSSAALRLALEKLGINACVVLNDKMIHMYEFTGWETEILNDSHSFDCVVGVDFGDLSRCGDTARLFEKAKTKIIIDHHIDKEPVCELFITMPEQAACAQIIFDLINLMGIEIDNKIATALYLGIMTDTGGCRYGNTTARTHVILSQLIDKVDGAYICRMVFDIASPQKMQGQTELMKTLERFENGKISTFCAKGELSKNEDALGSGANLALNLEGSVAGVLFKQRGEAETKVSLRTLGEINASKVCGFFGGGGHFSASGCTINLPVDEAKKVFLEKLIEEINLYI